MCGCVRGVGCVVGVVCVVCVGCVGCLGCLGGAFGVTKPKQTPSNLLNLQELDCAKAELAAIIRGMGGVGPTQR